MKKTSQLKKLQLSRTTVRVLMSAEMGEAHGGLRDTHSCQWCPPPLTAQSCSCKNSVCNSCYNTDCCLMEP